ncbi:hypothetical protein Tdes44962_MAKER06680 [Teratosphaeria destructans]|uniref:Uncharacterized protein n=1 Tax=Teratosphaeria destructans TaxID=418781 RepID=A0A9W7T1J8_9PEZI|nr:hypothetical protein Tdes44962_MAKER06680 [Teratosphaeria destructans]
MGKEIWVLATSAPFPRTTVPSPNLPRETRSESSSSIGHAHPLPHLNWRTSERWWNPAASSRVGSMLANGHYGAHGSGAVYDATLELSHHQSGVPTRG